MRAPLESRPRGRRAATRFSLAWLGAVCVLGACIDELPVEVIAGEDIEVTLDRFQDTLVVGQTDFVGLVVELDRTSTLGGLRVQWRSLDPTALFVRSLADSTLRDSIPLGTLTDSLLSPLYGEITALRRGDHAFEVRLDSLGVPGIEADTVEVPVVERWQSVSAGVAHTCGVTFVDGGEAGVALRPGGEMFCWGQGEWGALGTGTADIAYTPVPVITDLIFERVEAGGLYSCASDVSGLLHCWGENFRGQLGLGNQLDQFVPRLTSLGKAFSTFDVSDNLFNNFTCAVEIAGREGDPPSTLCWGDNSLGQLGCGELQQRGCDDPLLEPNTVEGSAVIGSDGSPIFIDFLSVGRSHACGVDGEGIAFCWGDNGGGQLGAIAAPGVSRVALEVAEGVLQFADVAAGDGFTCGLDIGLATVTCWGALAGVGGGASPVAIEGLPPGPYRSLTAGSRHACVLAGLALYCWGDNDRWQLGDGTVTESAQAIRVAEGDLSPFEEWESVSAGAEHTCAIAQSLFDEMGGGRVYCWGDNLSGQLGLGPGIERSAEPRRIVEPG